MVYCRSNRIIKHFDPNFFSILVAQTWFPQHFLALSLALPHDLVNSGLSTLIPIPFNSKVRSLLTGSPSFFHFQISVVRLIAPSSLLSLSILKPGFHMICNGLRSVCDTIADRSAHIWKHLSLASAAICGTRSG